MQLVLLGALLAVPVAGPPGPPRPAAAEVAIHARTILIPHLPTTVSQAHAEYGTVGPQIDGAFQDLERDLDALYRGIPADLALPGSISPEPGEAEAVRFFAAMLKDEQYARLEGAVLEAWNQWQSILLAAGLAEGEPGLPAGGGTGGKADQELARGLKAIRRSPGALEAERREMRERATVRFGPVDQGLLNLMQDSSSRSNSRLLTGQKLRIVAERKAPQLAQLWSPLAAHLHACAARMADLDNPAAPYKSQGAAALKLQAKIVLLERCRSALWFSRTVWARMTSNAAPAPLRCLRPSGGPEPAASEAPHALGGSSLPQ